MVIGKVCKEDGALHVLELTEQEWAKMIKKGIVSKVCPWGCAEYESFKISVSFKGRRRLHAL
jgi:hypothetical protein